MNTPTTIPQDFISPDLIGQTVIINANVTADVSFRSSYRKGDPKTTTSTSMIVGVLKMYERSEDQVRYLLDGMTGWGVFSTGDDDDNDRIRSTIRKTQHGAAYLASPNPVT